MELEKRSNERRSHKRFCLITDAIAFVTNSSPHCTMACRIADICHGGLSLSHFGGKLPRHSTIEVDIILPGEGMKSKKKMTGDSIWDIDVENNPRVRLCGIQFRDLTDDQMNFVDFLVENFTTTEAES